MPESQRRETFWARVKKSRIAQVLVAYLAVSWGTLQVTEILQQAFSLPQWVLPLTVTIGLNLLDEIALLLPPEIRP